MSRSAPRRPGSHGPGALEFSAQVDDRDVQLDFTVDPGETIALLGPNGAGKSTVLSVVAGLLRPDRAEVVLDGRPLTVAGSGRSAYVAPHEREIALLAQEPRLFPHLSVRDNVEFAPRAHGASRAEAHAVADHWLSEVSVAELADRKPHQISGGQAQRAAVARALAADPRLLLLDEPMAALDVAVTPALRQTLRRVLADRSVILVTHDALDALLLADTVIVIEDGRISEQGPAGAILTRPRSAFAARIAGLNILTGTWRDGRLHTADGTTVQGMVDGTSPQESERVTAVFSPTAVSIYRQPPTGSPRNMIATRVDEIEPHGDRARVRAGGLSADITPQAVAELDLVPGTQVHLSVKATEVTIYSS